MQSVNGERGTLCRKPVDGYFLLNYMVGHFELERMKSCVYALSVAYQKNAVKIEMADFRN